MDIRPGGPDGNHFVLFRRALGNKLGHLRRDGAGVQVNELHAQLAHQRVDELAFRDEAMLLQNSAQPLAGALLKLQRLIQLSLGDVAAFNQQIAEFNVLHGVVSSSFGGFKQRMTTPSGGVSALMPLSFQTTFSFNVKQAVSLS